MLHGNLNSMKVYKGPTSDGKPIHYKRKMMQNKRECFIYPGVYSHMLITKWFTFVIHNAPRVIVNFHFRPYTSIFYSGISFC